MEKLTDAEINWRMQEWRNIKKLHEKAVAQNKKLRKQHKKDLARIMELEGIVQQQQEMIQILQLQIEELRQIVFGRRKKKKEDDHDDNEGSSALGGTKSPRSKESYQRPIPEIEDITAREYHVLGSNCDDCGTSLQDKEMVDYYEEDIPLPDKGVKLKQVILHHVEKGWCFKCRKWKTASSLPSAKVILGQNVRYYILYLNILLRLSFSQIRTMLWDTYHFKVSEGEIAKILHLEADKLRPEFERLKKKLQSSKGVHLDETGWCHGLYLWVMAAMEGEEVLYLAGKCRGKGIAEDLLGNDFTGVRITDGYAAYNKQAGKRQQCWAHPHRKLRELAGSETISDEIRVHCQKTYDQFSEIYTKLREHLKEDFDQEKRQDQKQQLLQVIRTWTAPHANDPKKLKNIKLQFAEYEAEWFTCMDYAGIPCDNNKAERKLRHFVIKRKISFGNKSKKGHETFETLASVLMTTWKNHADDFFSQLKLIAQPQRV